MSKSYPVLEKGVIKYQYQGKKWAFLMPNNNVFLEACGGRERAERVAGAVSGAFKRAGQMDNLARANVKMILNS